MTSEVITIDTLSATTPDPATLNEKLALNCSELMGSMVKSCEAMGAHSGFFMTGLTVFVLACFVGYYVVWRVTPALHSPLMAITTAISSVIIVGALIAAGASEGSFLSKTLGFFAIILASINIFGGFIITRRMLHMFKKKAPKASA
jgi:NAD(P) transhydrogenase subunit alpha